MSEIEAIEDAIVKRLIEFIEGKLHLKYKIDMEESLDIELLDASTSSFLIGYRADVILDSFFDPKFLELLNIVLGNIIKKIKIGRTLDINTLRVEMGKALIVDDSKLMRESLKMILEDLGHEVVCLAENGKKAFVKYKECKPDFATMDINMPKMDGITVAILDGGAQDFIVKPFEPDDIKKALAGCGL